MGEGQSDEKRENVELDKYSASEIASYLRDRLTKDPSQLPNPNAVSLLDQIINYPAQNQTKEELAQTESEAEEWASKIKYHFLNGKFGNGWQTQNGPLQFDHTTSDFRYTEVIGNFNIPPNVINGRNYQNIKATQAISSHLYHRKEQKDMNYLIIGVPSTNVNTEIGLAAEYLPLRYLMWSHKDVTPDTRGHHTPLEYEFFLPKQEANVLLEKIGKNPNLIEDIFQLQHPGLIAPGQVQRVRVNQLSIIDVQTATKDVDLLTSLPPNSYAIRTITPRETLNFTNPVGELPG